MQDLQGDLAALAVDRVGDLLMMARLASRGELRGEGVEAALDVRGKAAGDDEAGAALRPLGVKSSQPLEVAGAILEPGVHRSHDRAVAQGGESQVQGEKRFGYSVIVVLRLASGMVV